jgi:predicted transcriptional regulator
MRIALGAGLLRSPSERSGRERRTSQVSFQLNLHTETVNHCHPAEVLCFAPADSVAEAMRQMNQKNRGAVLVCHNQMVVGIFTERDALRMMASAESFDTPLAKAMTANPVVLRASDTVGKAIKLMAHGGYRRLPIVDDHGRPTGVLTVQGIMHYLVEHFPTVIYNLPPEPHQATQMREGA